jgi:flagellar secretion chaperone FliS
MSGNVRTQQAIAAYRGASVAVPPIKVIVKLYDTAIVRLERAVLALEARRFEDSFNNVTAVASILRGLSYNLDFERGGEIAVRLRAMYGRNILALVRSVGKPDAVTRFRLIGKGLRDLRDAWSEIAKLPPESYRNFR